MENFFRAHQRRMESVTAADICNYLEGLMRKGQVEWQVKQSLDAIGLLMRYGYEREDLMIPAIREAWGLRLNQRVGISVPDINTTATGGVATVSERLRRVLRVAHYALRTEKSYTQWWERFEKFVGNRPEAKLVMFGCHAVPIVQVRPVVHFHAAPFGNSNSASDSGFIVML